MLEFDRKWETAEKTITAPLRWRKASRVRIKADLFHESVPDEWIDRVFAVMALAPQHTFQILTKRPERMREYIKHNGPTLQQMAEVPQVGRGVMTANTDWPLPNVWLGVSVEDQATADERIPFLLATPAAKRFISAEPLLGPIDLAALPFPKSCDCKDAAPRHDALNGTVYCAGCCEGPEALDMPVLDWIIVGGESGPNARPMHPDWARSLRDQCAEAGVPYFFKQWGEWLDERQVAAHMISRPSALGTIRQWPNEEYAACRVGKKAAGHILDGREHLEFPA